MHSHLYPQDDGSPGPAYNVRDSLNRYKGKSLKFGTGTRLFSPELGGNKAGPIISPLHAMASQAGAESPGPGSYDARGNIRRHGPKFGTAGKGANGFLNMSRMGPGPGAYYPGRMNSKHQMPPSFHMGLKLK